jgi:hypothetical protein
MFHSHKFCKVEGHCFGDKMKMDMGAMPCAYSQFERSNTRVLGTLKTPH